ncbi:MAG: hypothetical protein CMO01_25295 [Thalassobius sp.]|nr:hypothetical protein [Thalassovita sp.]
MMKYVFMFMPILVGMGVVLQTGANTQLKQYVGSPFLAALVSFTTGMLCVLVVNLFVGSDFKQLGGAQIQQTSWWMWIGGALGAMFVTSAIVIAPKLGPTQFFGLVIASQLIFSVVVDHFGWMGFEQQPVNMQKLIGIGLLVVGGYLIQSARS